MRTEGGAQSRAGQVLVDKTSGVADSFGNGTAISGIG